MSDGNLNERYNTLAARFDDTAQLVWLKAPTASLEHDCMRDLMLVTRLLGNEQPAEVTDNLIDRSWDYQHGDWRMKLAFKAMSEGEGTQMAGFQFKLSQRISGLDKIVMTGFDSRNFNGAAVPEEECSMQMSMAKGMSYQRISRLHAEINDKWKSSEPGSINDLYNRALRNDFK